MKTLSIICAASAALLLAGCPGGGGGSSKSGEGASSAPGGATPKDVYEVLKAASEKNKDTGSEGMLKAMLPHCTKDSQKQFIGMQYMMAGFMIPADKREATDKALGEAFVKFGGKAPDRKKLSNQAGKEDETMNALVEGVDSAKYADLYAALEEIVNNAKDKAKAEKPRPLNRWPVGDLIDLKEEGDKATAKHKELRRKGADGKETEESEQQICFAKENGRWFFDIKATSEANRQARGDRPAAATASCPVCKKTFGSPKARDQHVKDKKGDPNHK